MRDIAIGDAIYSVVKIQDLERRFVVVDVDELHNLKAVPLCQNVQGSEMFAFRKRSGLKQVAADLGTEVSMSAAWPWIKQPLHFSDTEMKELEQKREEYGKDHQITMIAADEPVEHLPDFDQGILDLYNSFQEDPARIKEYLEVFDPVLRIFPAQQDAYLYAKSGCDICCQQEGMGGKGL